MYLRRARPGSGGEMAWASPDNSSAWASLVEILQKEPSLEGVPMFRLLGFQDRADNLLPAVAVRNRFWRRTRRIQGFQLVEHRRYRLRILEWAEPPLQERLPQVRVQCEFNAGALDLEELESCGGSLRRPRVCVRRADAWIRRIGFTRAANGPGSAGRANIIIIIIERDFSLDGISMAMDEMAGRSCNSNSVESFAQ